METLVAVEDDWTDEVEGGNEVQLGAQKAGVAFRAEMWATDFFLANWMYIVAVLVTVLVGVFVYGQYASYERNLQLAAAREVAEEEIHLPASVGELSGLIASGRPVDEAKLVEVAKSLEAVDTTGAAKVESMVKAAELYRLANLPEDQRRALEQVVATGVDPMATLSNIALANLDLEAGNGDAAVQRLQGIANRKDYLGEQATLDLGMMHEHLGDNAAARGVYQDFTTRYPESPRAELARKRADALSEG